MREDFVQKDEYFGQVYGWYSEKYVLPYSHFAKYFVSMCVLIVAALIILSEYMINISSTSYRLPLYNSDQVNDFYRAKLVTKRNEPVNVSVARYLIEEYVEKRESYILNEMIKPLWKKKLINLKAQSSRKVFNDYIASVDPRMNHNSPVIRYKTHTDRLVKDFSVQFPQNSTRPSFAIVRFVVVEKTQNQLVENPWEARLEFSMSDIEELIDSHDPLHFSIIQYSSYPIQKQR